ncbi:MAG TPA: hypothetical protein VGK47_04900, partial [Nitrososphaeraceae archaeon]
PPPKLGPINEDPIPRLTDGLVIIVAGGLSPNRFSCKKPDANCVYPIGADNNSEDIINTKTGIMYRTKAFFGKRYFPRSDINKL